MGLRTQVFQSTDIPFQHSFFGGVLVYIPNRWDLKSESPVQVSVRIISCLQEWNEGFLYGIMMTIHVRQTSCSVKHGPNHNLFCKEKKNKKIPQAYTHTQINTHAAHGNIKGFLISIYNLTPTKNTRMFTYNKAIWKWTCATNNRMMDILSSSN